MANYLVTWVVDVDDVDTPEEAAARCLIIQRDTESIATVFEVKDKATGDVTTIDLRRSA